jgi:hypothetical protein
MSKKIHKVRPWRVRYWENDVLLYEAIVDAPTKLFAKWAARDKALYSGQLASICHRNRVTVFPVTITTRLVP